MRHGKLLRHSVSWLLPARGRLVSDPGQGMALSYWATLDTVRAL
jgi:hypothetical protein